MIILLTGGTGYIGSHTATAALAAGHEVILYDNLSNSHAEVIEKMQAITKQNIPFIHGDVLDAELLYQTLLEYKVDAVIHLAGLKSVKDSSEYPIQYYHNNVSGTISLLQAMRRADVKKLVFSSSATVYGEPQYLPYDENHPTKPINVYGRTKLQIEDILRDVVASDSSWRVLALRYFNPVGAHASGLIGENPQGIPNNLMPYVAKVAAQELPILNIFGDDYATKDGTGERDYIHVMDLAEGHTAAVNYLENHEGFRCINLGTGTSYSVLDLVKSFEQVLGNKIPYQISPRRQGDLPKYYADASLAHHLLNWQAHRSLHDMCHTTWLFKKNSQEGS
jgi:UDP-glucose 4-epimerase